MNAPGGDSRRSLTSVARNAASLLTSDALNKATTFVVYALVARYADARAFGQLSLGLLLAYTFQVFACGGLPTLITRDLASRPQRTRQYVVAGSVIVSGAALVAVLFMALLPVALRYETDTQAVIAILSLGLAPQALALVAESVFRAWERMHYIAYANVPANVLKMVGAYLLLRAGYGVVAIAALIVACRIVVLVVEWLLLVPRIWPFDAHFDKRYVGQLAARGATFLGIDGLIAVWGSLDAILISKFWGESEVGIYSAAWQLLVPVAMLFQSLVSSVFPVMCQKSQCEPARLESLVRWLVEFLALVGCPLVVGLYFLAEPGLLLLYGEDEFLASANVVRALLIVLVLQVLTSALGHALWARLQERVTLRIVSIDILVNLAAGFALIPQYGAIGAAAAAACAWLVNAVQHHLACARSTVHIPLATAMWKPATASAAMAATFVSFSSANPWTAGAAAALAYLTVVGVLLVVTSGGRRGLRTEFFSPLLK